MSSHRAGRHITPDPKSSASELSSRAVSPSPRAEASSASSNAATRLPRALRVASRMPVTAPRTPRSAVRSASLVRCWFARSSMARRPCVSHATYLT